MPKTFRFQSAGANRIVFADTLDLDHIYSVGVERTWSDSSKAVRLNRYHFRELGSAFKGTQNGCEDKCSAKRVTESFSLTVGLPTPYSKQERDIVIARFKEFSNNVITSLERDAVAAGNLPPATAEYNGTVFVPTP